ncbi:hypothetical protein ACIPQH_13270 [Streptomyces rubiginosohelvolus]|uniref:effector-associated domain 2-containing protein n=1 Tax=Streptomyces TaxID=1883 RepID=UPI001CD674A2|nr:hypothetical protein [Streptomyces sp. 7G]MCA1269866.1 hypothetical protein [Streptomyces sp. 7G]
MNAVPHGRPGPDLVQILVDALTLLDCVKDRSQRFEFVDVVAYRLDIELTYPDTTPRIDMTHVVRKVIHRPGGPEALIYAVRAVSGKDDADRIAAEAGIRTDGERPGAWPAPVFADDVARQARRLLGETADIDAGRLRALLAEELPGELPDHGTPAGRPLGPLPGRHPARRRPGPGRRTGGSPEGVPGREPTGSLIARRDRTGFRKATHSS